MRCPIIFPLVVFLMITGCAATQQADLPPAPAELISMPPLPPLTSPANATGLKMDLLLHVRADGTVGHVRMLGSTGDVEWDSLALRSIRQWRYAVPHADSAPAGVWFRQLVIVQVQEPVVMALGEMWCGSQREGDSLYGLLQQGIALDSLFTHPAPSVNVGTYPGRIREELVKLGEGECTRPLRIGERYVIYKRYRG